MLFGCIGRLETEPFGDFRTCRRGTRFGNATFNQIKDFLLPGSELESGK